MTEHTENLQEHDKIYRKPELTDLGPVPQLTEGGSGEAWEPFGAIEGPTQVP